MFIVYIILIVLDFLSTQESKNYCGISVMEMFRLWCLQKNTMRKHQTLEEHRYLKQSQNQKKALM